MIKYLKQILQTLNQCQAKVNKIIIIIGDCLKMLNKPLESMVWYDKCLNIEPNNIQSLLGKGIAIE